MPTAKEFTIRLDDKPGTLGKLCQALAEGGVNILAVSTVRSRKGQGLCPSRCGQSRKSQGRSGPSTQ